MRIHQVAVSVLYLLTSQKSSPCPQVLHGQMTWLSADVTHSRAKLFIVYIWKSFCDKGQMKWPLQNELDWSQQEFIEQGVCGQDHQSWMSLRGRKKALPLPQRRSQFSEVDEMNRLKQLENFTDTLILQPCCHVSFPGCPASEHSFYVWRVFHLMNLEEIVHFALEKLKEPDTNFSKFWGS